MDRAPESPTNWPEEHSDISQGIPTQMDEDNSLRDRRTSRNNHFNRLNAEETTTFGRASRQSQYTRRLPHKIWTSNRMNNS
jgi:hypothetical protein